MVVVVVVVVLGCVDDVIFAGERWRLTGVAVVAIVGFLAISSDGRTREGEDSFVKVDDVYSRRAFRVVRMTTICLVRIVACVCLVFVGLVLIWDDGLPVDGMVSRVWLGRRSQDNTNIARADAAVATKKDTRDPL